MAHIYIFDKDDNFLKILSEDEFNNDEHKRQLNGSWTFRFEVSIGYANDLLKGHKIGFYDRENEFRLFTIAEVPEATYHEDILDVYCTNDYFDLVDGIVEDKRIREGSAREALAKVLDGTKFEIGEVADLGLRTINFYDISRMEALQNIVKTYGGEIDYRIELNNSKTGIARRIIDLKARLGSDTGLRYTFDSNLKAVKRTDVSEGHFTVLYGRGKGIESGDGYSNKIKFTDIEWNTPLNPIDKPLGQSYIEDEEAIAKWGRIEGIYENSDIEDPEELLQETYKVLQQVKIPTLSYEVSAEDLSNQNGYEHFKTTIGDSVILLDEDYNLNLESRIVEITESIKSVEAEQSLILGYIQPSFTDSSGNSQITAPSFIESGTGDIEVDDTNFPNTLPQTPILKAKGLFSSVMLEWTFESKTYYNYEIYASEIQHFNPDSSNLIFRGKASSLLHEVKPSETWYYRARAINTHGEVTEMSDEVSATAFKISDATEYFEDVAIKEALIDTLSLDRGWFGQLKGQFMDVKNLVVTDGNNVRTMYVDDFGRVHMNVSELKINSKDVLNHEQTETLIEAKAGEISLSVAKKEVATAKSEINKTLDDYSTTAEMQAAIKVVKDEINLGVSSLTETVESTTTLVQSHTQQLAQKADLETVNEKIDAIPFVGRNLFLNSDFSSQESWAGLPTISKDGTINYIRSSSTFITSQKVDVIEGEEYVVSALVRAVTTTPTNFSIKFNVGNYNSTNIDITSTDWVRVSVTITAKSTIKEQIYLCNRGNAGIDIAFVKLEKGTKDTDWSLAPEDIQASIDAKANSSDVYVKTEVYTKAQTDSAIKLAKDEINLGVSSTYETKTNVETQINGVKSSVTNLESRVSKAEQKITDSAIISTVQNTINTAKTEAINSANSNTANQLKNYSTTSQMNSAINQKADSITSEVVKIENSMAIDNLLANGNFTNNLNNWQYSDYGSPVNYSLSANTDWTMIGKTALLLTQSWHPQGYDSGFTQEIEVKPNTDYTFTGYIASHRAEGLIIIKDEAGNWLTFDKTDADYDQYTGGANIANWKRIRVVYYSGNRTKLRLHLALGKSNDNGHVWFHDFMVTEGETDLCWKPSERETRTQISQLNDKIETKASIDNMWSYIQQNPYAVMTAINNGRGINGISIDENGLSVFRNNIISMMLNDGKTQLYNPYSGTYMGYFGTEDNDLRVQLTGASTFSVRGGYNDVRMLDLDFNHGHAYGNSTMRICGDVLFQHRDDPNATGVNGLGLGNDDRADMYGHHNIFLLCHNSFGIADNNGLTNGFYDARRGRWVIKGGLYQNTESPPSAYILSIDEEHPFFCGKTKMNIVDSILNLETTIKVDNEDDLTMMILPNDDDLVMTDIGNQKHIDQSSIIAGLVETVKSLNNRMLELESELNKRGR